MTPPVAVVLSLVLALVTVWAAIASSHLSNWPVGFFVGAFGALCYGAGRAWAAWRGSRSGALRGATAAGV